MLIQDADTGVLVENKHVTSSVGSRPLCFNGRETQRGVKKLR